MDAQKIVAEICHYLLFVFGVICLSLAVVLPFYFEQLRGVGTGVVFIPGWQSLQEAFNILLTTFSILSAISLAFVVLPFPRDEKPSRKPVSMLLAVITLVLFVCGIILSLFFSLERSLTGRAPTELDLYVDLGILLSSLGFMFLMVATNIQSSSDLSKQI